MNTLANQAVSWPQAAIAITGIIAGVAIASWFLWLIFRS